MKPGPGSISRRPLVALAAACAIAIASLCALSASVHAESTTSVQAATTAQATTTQTSFTDIKGTESFAEAVYALAAKGIVEGRQDGTFGPNESLTRAQMAVFLTRAMGLQESQGQPFFDIKTTDWFAGAVGALFQKGLIQGTSPIMFSPDQPISRQQAVTLVMRSLQFFLQSDQSSTAGLGLIQQDETQKWLAGFRDRQLIASAHRVSVANAFRLGVLGGSADGWLFPQCNLTRAQMAVMLYRAFLQPIQAKSAYPAEVPAVSSYESLSSGSKGTLVTMLETRLSALGYICGPVDGTYDYRTRDAVMAFEKVERLSRDGRVNAAVWERLLSAQAPTPRESAAGTRCEVDISRQVLFMITDNKVWKILHVSTGKKGTRTGHFSIGAKYEGWVHCVTLDGEMYYPSYVVSKTAIHGYKSVPNYPASHGCVRIPVWTAAELWGQLPTGTQVDIYY